MHIIVCVKQVPDAKDVRMDPRTNTLDELDRIAHEYMCDHGAYPSCLGYMGFPKSICTSVNEVICHGIPDSTVLAEGDLINLDVTAYLDGVHGDTNATFPVGRVDPETAALIERTRTAMERGIRAVRPGREINVIGRVIEKYAKRFDYGVVRDYTGHGVGKACMFPQEAVIDMGVVYFLVMGAAGAAGSLLGGVLLDAFKDTGLLYPDVYRVFFALQIIIIGIGFCLQIKLKTLGSYSLKEALPLFFSPRDIRGLGLLYKLDRSKQENE